jgi:hypothetical protein
VPDGANGAQLLERHLPVLRYDSQGSFTADSCAVLTNRTAPAGDPTNCLKRADGTVLATAAGGGRHAKLDLDFLGWPEYGDGTRGARSDYLDAVGRDYLQQAREMHRPPFADRVHGHAVRAEDEGSWLQYWFFYLYNDKAFLGFGLHEGDWELVQVRLDRDARPQAMAFAQHSHGQRCRWEVVEKRGERPVVYVARGSQASYPFAGRHKAPIVPDHADGKGPEVAEPTLELIDDAQPGWVAWPGRWGSSKARSVAESNSPRGPAHQEKWSDPETFHQECDEVDPLRMAPEPPPPTPPQPRISAHREGNRAVIAYRFPAAPTQPAPAQLILTLDSAGDELPPATHTWAVEHATGEVEHPLSLEEKRYEVRASAADRHGNASDPTVSELR